MKVEIIGFYEEFLVDGVDSKKCIGTRVVPYEPGRSLGYDGAKEIIITESLTLDSGHKKVYIKASATKPLMVTTMLNMLNGRLERNISGPIQKPYFDTDTKTIYGVPGLNPAKGWSSVD